MQWSRSVNQLSLDAGNQPSSQNSGSHSPTALLRNPQYQQQNLLQGRAYNHVPVRSSLRWGRVTQALRSQFSKRDPSLTTNSLSLRNKQGQNFKFKSSICRRVRSANVFHLINHKPLWLYPNLRLNKLQIWALCLNKLKIFRHQLMRKLRHQWVHLFTIGFCSLK